MHVIDYVIYGLWVLFWVVWLAAALTAKGAAHTRTRHFVGVRLIVLVIVIAISRTRFAKDHHAAVSNHVLQGVGTVLFLAGLGIALWARVYLGRNWGTPMSEKVDAELVTTGPYRYVRNPIYSGLILAALGTSIAVSWLWLIAVVFMSGYFIYSASVEEEIMERLFPEKYPAYRRTTKILIPYIF